MNLEEIARAYVRCIDIEQQASGELAEDVSLLRSDLHALLMQALREAKISFTDRADAARIAYELTAKKQAAS